MRRMLCLGLLLLLAVIACNLPSAAVPTNSLQFAVPSITHAVSQTTTAISTAEPIGTLSITPIPSLTDTSVPAVSPTPQNPLVKIDSLCWGGPGKTYEVISTIRSGTRVVLLGRGIIDGWWIVKNPTYHDPCWLPAGSLQIDPAMDLSGLQVYKVPPTPTP